MITRVPPQIQPIHPRMTGESLHFSARFKNKDEKKTTTALESVGKAAAIGAGGFAALLFARPIMFVLTEIMMLERVMWPVSVPMTAIGGFALWRKIRKAKAEAARMADPVLSRQEKQKSFVKIIEDLETQRVEKSKVLQSAQQAYDQEVQELTPMVEKLQQMETQLASQGDNKDRALVLEFGRQQERIKQQQATVELAKKAADQVKELDFQVDQKIKDIQFKYETALRNIERIEMSERVKQMQAMKTNLDKMEGKEDQGVSVEMMDAEVKQEYQESLESLEKAMLEAEAMKLVLSQASTEVLEKELLKGSLNVTGDPLMDQLKAQSSLQTQEQQTENK